jgi:F-type H+-transporting ATPase subunit b
VLIDPFTIVAQIINFLILVFLLQRFLYRPIVTMMANRRERIEADLAAAERKREEAREEIETYRRKNEELDEERESLLVEAKEAAESERHRLLAEAREEVEKARSRWQQALDEEKEAFLLDLRQHVGEHSYRVMRRALAELADTELEEQVTAVFLRRLTELDTEQRQLLQQADGANWTIHTAFELSPEKRDQIRQQLVETLDYEGDLQFSHNSDLICGLELQTTDHKVAWTIASYLDELEEAASQLVA